MKKPALGGHVLGFDNRQEGGHLTRTEAYMGLNIYRKRDQQLLLTVEPGTTAEQLLEQLRAGITIRVCEIQKQQVLSRNAAGSAPLLVVMRQPGTP